VAHFIMAEILARQTVPKEIFTKRGREFWTEYKLSSLSLEWSTSRRPPTIHRQTFLPNGQDKPSCADSKEKQFATPPTGTCPSPPSS
jgi:hypothetical protein